MTQQRPPLTERLLLPLGCEGCRSVDEGGLLGAIADCAAGHLVDGRAVGQEARQAISDRPVQVTGRNPHHGSGGCATG